MSLCQIEEEDDTLWNNQTLSQVIGHVRKSECIKITFPLHQSQAEISTENVPNFIWAYWFVEAQQGHRRETES